MIHILIIDDDVFFVQVLSTVLELNDFKVSHAATGYAGLEAAKTPGIDFILCDQILPDLSGNEVLKLLKADPLSNPIPVAMFTSYVKPDTQKDAMRSGAVGYILKHELDIQNLPAIIKQFMTPKPTAAPNAV